MIYIDSKYNMFELKINDIIELCKIYHIYKYDIGDDGLLTTYCDVDFSNNKKLEKLPLKFKEIFGSFYINNTNINCLLGSPRIVHRVCNIGHTKIKNLKYCPNEIGVGLYCNFNKNLKYFKNFPGYIELFCHFDCCDLKSLYGCPNDIKYSFVIHSNYNICSLKYGPKYVNGDYNCAECNLKSLYGAPEFVGGYFDCSGNKLTSLKYSPKYIGDYFNFNKNNIYTFEYIPDFFGEIYCENNPIYNIWKLFEDKNQIEYFNQMKIITDENKINIKKLNLFLKSIDKEPVKNVYGYINI